MLTEIIDGMEPTTNGKAKKRELIKRGLLKFPTIATIKTYKIHKKGYQMDNTN